MNDEEAKKKRKELAEKLKRGEKLAITPSGKIFTPDFSIVERRDLEKLSFSLYKVAEYQESVSTKPEKVAATAEIKKEALRIALKLRYGGFLNIRFPATYEDIANKWQEIARFWRFIAINSPLKKLKKELDEFEGDLSNEENTSIVNNNTDEFKEYLTKIYDDSFPEGDALLSNLLKEQKARVDWTRTITIPTPIPDGHLALPVEVEFLQCKEKYS